MIWPSNDLETENEFLEHLVFSFLGEKREAAEKSLAERSDYRNYEHAGFSSPGFVKRQGVTDLYLCVLK